MKVILTEVQYRQLTEENLREFLYSFWDNQKRQGEDPSLDDIIFQVTDIRRNSREDHQSIRPLWYEYNGGYDVFNDTHNFKKDIRHQGYLVITPKL